MCDDCVIILPPTAAESPPVFFAHSLTCAVCFIRLDYFQFQFYFQSQFCPTSVFHSNPRKMWRKKVKSKTQSTSYSCRTVRMMTVEQLVKYFSNIKQNLLWFPSQRGSRTRELFIWVVVVVDFLILYLTSEVLQQHNLHTQRCLCVN